MDEGEKKKNRAAKRIRRKLTKKAQKAQKAKAKESSEEEETEHEHDQLILEDSDLEAAMQED